jgi:hypothetical protein
MRPSCASEALIQICGLSKSKTAQAATCWTSLALLSDYFFLSDGPSLSGWALMTDLILPVEALVFAVPPVPS